MFINNEEKYIKEWEFKRKPYPAVSWDNIINSRPIEDMRSWQKDLANICGIYGNIIEFNIKTFSLICDSDENKRLGYEKITSPSDLISLLWSKTSIVINEYLKDGKVIIKSASEYLPNWYEDIEATMCEGM